MVYINLKSCHFLKILNYCFKLLFITALAKDAFNRMKSIMKDKNISMNTKIRIVKTYIYGQFCFMDVKAGQ